MPDFASPCSPAAALTPGPASPCGAVHPFAVCAHCAWKNTAKPPSGKIMAWPVEINTEHFALVLPVHSALQLLFFYFYETLEVMLVSGWLEKCVLHPGFTELSLGCLHLSPRVTQAKPVCHRAGDIYGQIDASRTVGSSILSKCLTYIIAESTGSGYKARSEKLSCLAMVSVRSGVVGHHLVYFPRGMQGRRRKHSSPAMP